MLLTEQQADQRLNSPNNLALKFGAVQVNPIPKRGRQKGSPNLPKFIHNTAAILARGTDEKGKDIAAALGTYSNIVSEVKNDHQDKVKTDKEIIEAALTPIRESALNVLTQALSSMTGDKIANAKLGTLSKVAADMGRVVEKTLPKEKEKSNQIQITFYSPQVKSESEFQVIEIGEVA